MDITAKYRTKAPPKEHEEAVRMLLEEIGATQAPPSESPPRGTLRTSYEYDRRSINSTGSIASEASPLNQNNGNRTGFRSKSTSTSESVLSSVSLKHDAAYREPIPSRTIAIQCDLKLSLPKREDFSDGSMQVSSISSTKYGFYNYTPEALESRRKLQRYRSMSSRNVAPTLRQANPPVARQINSQQQIEAPTFMSVLSRSTASLSASEDDLHRAFRNNGHQSKLSADSYESGSESATKADAAINGNSTRGIRVSTLKNSSSMYDSTLDNSRAHARLNSLPRRPMTALSYVSTTKLRGQESPDRSSEESDRVRPTKNRVLSQQVLSRPSTPAPNFHSTSSGSDSELSDTIARDPFELASRYQRAPRTEDILITKSQRMPMKPPRPTLVSSAHNEQVKDFKTLDRIATKTINHHQKPLSRANGAVLADKSNTNSLNQRNASHTAYKSRQPPESEFEFKKPPVNAARGQLQDENFNQDEGYPSRVSTIHQTGSEQPMETRYSTQNAHQFSNSEHRLGPSANNRLNSTLSLSRRAKPLCETNYNGLPTSGYYTSNRRPLTLSREDRAYSQTFLSKPSIYRHTEGPCEAKRHVSSSSGSDVCRSTSIRQIGRAARNDYGSPAAPEAQGERRTHGSYMSVPESGQDDLSSFRGSVRAEPHEYRGQSQNSSDNSDSPLTRTWANPSVKSQMRANLLNHSSSINNKNNRLDNERKSSRSFSMRDVNDDSYSRYTNYRAQANDFSSCNSSSESSSMENARRFVVRSHQLDYDSQHRLNESGLPEVASTQPRRSAAPLSYLGVTGRKDGALPQSFTSGRLSQVTGRAMSQQSLTRPTMPSIGGRRRGGSNSGSDVGGSSMSLVSRLHGRYENAHTRSPIVMYIPQATPKPSSLSDSKSSIIGKTSTLRKSSRSRQKSSSQDRLRRSLSRNRSDSESSSMLRTLVRPRNRTQGNYASKRASRTQDCDGDEEDLDNIGQLATEMDSYKFRRRYSVPKDAKINWFAKLRQRVTASAK